MAARRNWTETEVSEALALYLRLDFGRFHKRNPQVIALAERLDRTASAVALKLTNLAALDQSLARKGMAHASATDRRVWARFLTAPDEVLEAYRRQGPPEDPPVTSETAPLAGFAERQAHYEGQQSKSPVREVAARIGQDFFREMILTSYRGRCALTGTEDARLLTASHIIGWREQEMTRLHPTNGICLNALHDRAFDRHLITFDEDYRLVIAADIPPIARRRLAEVETQRLEMPVRFLPDQSYLEHHRRRFHERAA